jgi:bacterioferritin (cytochrome b1)
MKELANYDHTKVVNVLLARLNFERTGVKLYDSIIDKLSLRNDEDAQRVLSTLQEHRDEEKEHEEWLEEQVRSLGGDAHGSSDLSELETRESKGIEEIIIDGDNDIMHNFHALLAAELADNAGWDLLVQLADEAGDREARRQFKKRLHEEEEHLVFVRRVIERLARRSILGEEVRLPTSP